MKVVFAFLIKNKLSQEALWYEYLKSCSDYEILIHCSDYDGITILKNLNTTVYVKQVPSEWSRLLQVELFLLQHAKDKHADKVILLSDTCVPIKPLTYLYSHLCTNKSYIKYVSMFNDWKDALTRHRTHYDFLHGNHQWCILDKQHFDIFLNNKFRTEFETRVHYPEESYFSSMLCEKNLLTSDHVIDTITTYVDWSRGNGMSPYTFEIENEENVKIINETKNMPNILFFRKISPQSQLLNVIKSLL